MILFAQTANVPEQVVGNWAWGLAGFAVMLGGIFWCWNQARQALSGKTNQTISPQPFAVEITKQLHEQFADKTEFVNLKTHITKRHAEIFASIERAEKESRRLMDERFKELNEERRTTLEKLNEQLSFIRENIVEVRTKVEMMK